MNKRTRNQQGVILFVVLMILLMVSILVMMAVQTSKNNTKISLAQAQQVEAFDNAEAMLSRVRFALEQVPLPPSIALDSKPNNAETVIWITKQMADNLNNGAGGNIDEPLFAQPEFKWDTANALTCTELESWLRHNKSAVDLECDSAFPTEPDKQPLIFIEFVTKLQPAGDIDGMRGAYFYRITILGKGYQSGRNIVQGITGVEYI